jgi:hypothetical protein
MSPRGVRTDARTGVRTAGKTGAKIAARIVNTIAAAPGVTTTAVERTIRVLPVTNTVVRRTIDPFVTG